MNKDQSFVPSRSTDANGIEVGSFINNAFVAPEVLQEDELQPSADMWSIGALSYKLLCGYTPFQSANRTAHIVDAREGRLTFDTKYGTNIGKSAKDFISALLHFDPEKRITCQAALQHEWITGKMKGLV